VLELTAEEEAPDGLVRLLWLESLPTRVSENLPVQDLVDWLAENCSGRAFQMCSPLSAFWCFTPTSTLRSLIESRALTNIAGGEITASPVTLTST